MTWNLIYSYKCENKNLFYNLKKNKKEILLIKQKNIK